MILAPNVKGALLMIGSMAAFTFNDACIKLVASDMPLFQVVFLRGVLTSVMMVVLAWSMGLRSLRIPRGDRALVAARSVAEIAAMVPFFIALIHMPLANVAAILAALPLTITLAGALFLGEPVGWKRLGAILVGFAGVMLIIRPGFDGFTVYSLVALLAVAAVTARDLVTRRFSAKVPSMAVAVITAFSITAFGAAMSLTEEWQAVDARDAGLIALASVFIIGGYVFSIIVMRVGEISVVAPFRYTSLIWALLLGWLVFGDWPSILTLIGGAIVVVTGVFTLWREHVLAVRIRRIAHG